MGNNFEIFFLENVLKLFTGAKEINVYFSSILFDEKPIDVADRYGGMDGAGLLFTFFSCPGRGGTHNKYDVPR